MERHRNPSDSEAKHFSAVVELRQYALHPGRRDVLIELFDRAFVETQEAVGMKVIGQFRDLDRPDRFIWLRGFEDMEQRRSALTAFYDGPVWAAHRDAANATMIDSDDVLLLRPAWPGAGFDLAGATRERTTTVTQALAAVSGPGLIAELSGPAENRGPQEPGQENSPVVLATIFHISPAGEAEFTTLFEREAAPLLARLGAPLIAAFVTEHAENTFPRHPVRENENVLAAFARFADAAAHTRYQAALAASGEWRKVSARLAPHFSQPAETLRLSPTSRSLLR
jgi:hypothetical protein